jgi:putative DNA methylase
MSERQIIEVELPLPTINIESDTDKRTHDGHISTLHTWWARRPLPMARAMVAASLIDDAADRPEVIARLAQAMPTKGILSNPAVQWLSKRMKSGHPERPKVLDCFAGGGAIPLEALRLGCDTTAVDINPVAHVVQKAALEYPQRFGAMDERGQNTLVEDVKHWGEWVTDRAKSVVDPLYAIVGPADTPAPYYFWVRTMPSPDPTLDVEIPILSSRLLAEGRRQAWVDVEVGSGGVNLDIRQGQAPQDEDLKSGFESAGSVTCPISGVTAPQREVKAYGKARGFGYRLYAVCDVRGPERVYRNPHLAELEAASRAALVRQQLEAEEYPDGTSLLPDEIVDEIGYNNLQFLPYGYSSWRSLFTDRQLVLYATLASTIRAAHDEMLKRGMDTGRATAVATYLALVMDKVADRNSAFSSWQTGGEKIRGTFPGQTVQMRWDFCENYPFRRGSGSWDDALTAVCKVIEHCSQVGDGPAKVLRADAQDMPFETGTFDAVLIDPPYYFSVMYSDLSDFFYVWLKRSVGHLYPGHFHTAWTPKSQEVVQNRCAPSYPGFIGEEEFDRRLGRALAEVNRVVKPDGVVAIVFAHTDVKAWEKLLKALRTAGLTVSTSWPVRSEMKGRPVAHVKAALGSSVILVCRPNHVAGEAFYDDVQSELNQVIASRLDTFEGMGLHGADYFVSAVGPAFEVFARYTRVLRLSGEEVSIAELLELARKAVARYAMGRLLGGDSLRVLDERSLLYVTWRWAYLTVPIPDDEAFKLTRAFGIDLDDITRPGEMVRRTGKTFELLGPDKRKDISLRPDSPMIDVLHLLAQLWERGSVNEVVELLAASGYGDEPGFWDTAKTLSELLPEGDRERTMLQALATSQERLSVAASKHVGSEVEALTLFGTERDTRRG